ncbi:hypothetical protein DFR58_106108 [Anaerobacterium chartisolvens]|uniref:FAD-dependent protein C-terminal domain-containing protein n=2 Tax=Anaerobacterium chartisolvens TaxID=1297424 RepID=A0A369B8T3_9FIRM|nr:hypothetical protein [Anaerobacterium chartisolvens]RCX17940.1 hypothetical protein DFR58_106108 [Anaerobacterium chartisolvens]
MIKITGLAIPLDYDLKLLADIVADILHIDGSGIENIKISKLSVDASDKNNVCFKASVDAYVSGDEKAIAFKNRDKRISVEAESPYILPERKFLKKRPIVVGCGPAGLFAALLLAQEGARPILLERGLDVDSRKQSVFKFWQTGILDTRSNVQFGEGGAGAFSDGKLKIGRRDPRKMKILSELVEAGAPPEIMYLDKPHIGTDRLNETVKGIRRKIIRMGGEVHFDAVLTKILHKEGVAEGIGFIKNGKYEELYTDNVVVAIGHSARDTFENLMESGVYIEQKPFAVGVRIEHPRAMIDRIRYGSFAEHPALGAADYKMVVHLNNGRAVYTFCMCPGGSVIAATSEDNAIVINGMSEFARDGRNSNSALLVTLGSADLGSSHALAGVAFQRRLEAEAFEAGGGGYRAPVQRLEDFLNKRNSSCFGEVLPTYLPGTGFCRTDTYLPGYITDSLRQAIYEMEEWMPGFAYPDAVITGAETRSSSPVRITRGESLEAIGIKGLYPCGEGAGYAGGIISAAVDGMLCAERILE